MKLTEYWAIKIRNSDMMCLELTRDNQINNRVKDGATLIKVSNKDSGSAKDKGANREQIKAKIMVKKHQTKGTLTLNKMGNLLINNPPTAVIVQRMTFSTNLSESSKKK